MAHDDDLDQWGDDPLVRALRAPGTAAELAGEDAALAAFRSAAPRRSKRRLARRMGTGAGTLTIAVAFSGGVAAAYTHSLPDPMQRVAHSWFGGIGVGAPPPSHALAGHRPRPAHSAGGRVAPSPAGTTASAASPSAQRSVVPVAASSRPTRPATRPTTKPSRSAAPKAATGAGPVPTPTPRPSPTASGPSGRPRLRPADITGTVSAQRIPPASSVTMSGRLTSSSGAAVPGRRVVVQSRPAGQHQHWSPVGSARTDSSGDVTIDVPALSRTTRLRLAAPRHVHSPAATVVVVPTMAASLIRDGKHYDVSVTSDGLQPGDTIVVVRRVRGRRTVVDRVAVDGSGNAGFSVAVPPKRAVTFQVLTRRTASHAAAKTSFVAPRG